LSLTNTKIWLDPTALQRSSARQWGIWLTAGILAFGATFVVWASIATLDDITRGTAKVVPQSSVQLIQHLDGGIIRDLAIREGDLVERGQYLLTIENTKAESELGVLHQRQLLAMAAIARLTAHLAGLSDADKIVFPSKLDGADPAIKRVAMQHFAMERLQLEAQERTLTWEIEQRRHELSALDVKASALKPLIATATQLLGNAETLRKNGQAASDNEVLSRKEALARLLADADNAQARKPVLMAALANAQSKLEEARHKFLATAAEEMERQRTELDTVGAQISGAVAAVKRSNIVSPVNGIIKEIKLRTLGAVAKPGQDIVEIVPVDDTLIIEAKISPEERSFIAPGQSAIVKITAYDYSIFGGLEATVVDISADSILLEKEKSAFYRVKLRTKDSALRARDGSELAILPGMTASAEILTGKSTVLEKMLRPIKVVLSTGMTEH
jgi:adhesin transport system membrane fusion protein